MALSLTLLTVLMHFKYHVTSSDLVNAKFNVMANDLKWSIERSLRLGISLADLTNTQNLIQQTKKEDPMLDAVSVFALDNEDIKLLFKTEPNETLSKELSDKVRIALTSSRREYWTVSDGADTQYVGTTFRNPLGISVGGIYIRYSQSVVNKNQQREIYRLYIRLGGLIFFIGCFSFFIGWGIMKPLNASLSSMKENLNNLLLDPDNEPNLTDIAYSELRKDFLQTFQTTRETLKSLKQIERWIQEIR